MTQQAEMRSTMPERSCWGVVLAGGEGKRLRSVLRQALGDDRPKPYVRLLDPQTLLRQTLDRVALAIPGPRTLVVTVRHHAHYILGEFAGAPYPTILAQPLDRGTAAGVLYPAHWIAWRQSGGHRRRLSRRSLSAGCGQLHGARRRGGRVGE